MHEYAHDPRHESYGLEAAEGLEQEPARVFTTLVAKADAELVVCCVPVEALLDLKAVAEAFGARRAVLADPREAERATAPSSAGSARSARDAASERSSTRPRSRSRSST